MKIYVASSWRNEEQPALVERLRKEGHEVYDFRNPQGDGPGTGFGWQRLDPDWKNWTPEKYRLYLTHAVAQAGFESDERAMIRADACVLCLPAGRSAHLELGWMLGQGKLGYVLLSEKGFDPDLMYLLTPLHRIVLSEEALVQEIAADEQRKHDDELRPEYRYADLNNPRSRARWMGGRTHNPQNLLKTVETGRASAASPNFANLPNNPANEVAIAGGVCNMALPGLPLLLCVTEDRTHDTVYYAVAPAATKPSFVAATRSELVALLAGSGYEKLPDEIAARLAEQDRVPKFVDVYRHLATWKATDEWFESIKHLLP